MSVRVKLPPILQELNGGVETCEVDGCTVRECLEGLKARLPAIKDHLFDRHGQLLRIFGIYLSTERVFVLDLDTPVRGNDEIVILSFITGG